QRSAILAPEEMAARLKLVERQRQQAQDIGRRLAQAGIIAAADEPWVELASVRKALPAKSVLVEIARFNTWSLKEDRPTSVRYAAWIIPPAGETSLGLIDRGEAKAIDVAVAAVRQVLTNA